MTRKNGQLLGPALASLLALLTVSTAQAAAGGNPNSPLNEILDRLDALQTDIKSLKDDIAGVKTDVANVQREVITCTVRAKKAGLCDRVRSTKAQACFELAVLKASLGAKWVGSVKAAAEGGVGWTSGPDGKIKLDVKLPVAEVPSDFGLELAPELDLKGNVCVEVPIELLPATTVRSTNAARTADVEPEYEALATRFEEIGASVVPLLLDRIDSRMPSGDRLVTGVQAFERLGDGDLSILNGDLLSDPMLLEVANILPTPIVVRTALMNPGALSNRLPSLQGTAKQRLAALCNPNTGLSVVRSPLFAAATGQVCGFLNSVPEFNDIAGQLLDIPEATSALVDGLLDKTQQVAQNTSNWFCTRPLFQNTKLCK